MENALILHGTWDNSQKHWFPWLKRELIKRGWLVWTPDLPDSDHPNTEKYLAHLFQNQDWTFDSDSVIIGHSSGGVAALQLLQHLPANLIIDKCIVVGAFYHNHGFTAVDGLFEQPWDFPKIKKHARRFYIIHSNDDPYISLEDPKYFGEKLGSKPIIKKGQKHFSITTAGKKYKEFPFLLQLIEST